MCVFAQANDKITIVKLTVEFKFEINFKILK